MDSVRPLVESREEDLVLHPLDFSLAHQRVQRAGEERAPAEAVHLVPLHLLLLELDDADRRPTAADEDGHELAVVGLEQILVLRLLVTLVDPEAGRLVKNLEEAVVVAVQGLVVHCQLPVIKQHVERATMEDRVGIGRRFHEPGVRHERQVPAVPLAVVVLDGEGGPGMTNRVDAEHPLGLCAAVVDDEVEPSVYGRRQLVDIAGDEVGFQYLNWTAGTASGGARRRSRTWRLVLLGCRRPRSSCGNKGCRSVGWWSRRLRR